MNQNPRAARSPTRRRLSPPRPIRGDRDVAAKLEAFLNRVSHPRGRALACLMEASVTVDQAILLDLVRTRRADTSSAIARAMGLSLPSATQMIDRLVRDGLARRTEDPEDRRRRTIAVTAKARAFLTRLREVRIAELAEGLAGVTPMTRSALGASLDAALEELMAPPPSAPGEPS